MLFSTVPETSCVIVARYDVNDRQADWVLEPGSLDVLVNVSSGLNHATDVPGNDLKADQIGRHLLLVLGHIFSIIMPPV